MMRTFDQIAAELGMKRSTVATLYYRGLRKLREQTPNAVDLLSQMAADLQRERRAARGR